MNYQDSTKETIIADGGGTAVARAREEMAYVGAKIKDRYLIEKQLDSGGFGAVYLAHDQELLGKPVVIKLLHEKSLRSEWAVNKFKQEIEALARIDHSGVVGVLDTGQMPDGTPFLVMQYIKGVSLRTVMKHEGLEFERTSTFIRQLGQALNAAHETGIIHRDLKPENVMLQRVAGGEQVKIIDFGIAKVRDSQVAPSTQVAEVAGTIAYMAPEQLNGLPVSAATDQYALAVIAYEMLTGRRPFNPETQFQLAGLQRDGVKVKPKDLRPGLPGAAESVLLKALAYDPAQRYPTARSFADALADALVESGLVATHVDSNAQTILSTQVIAYRAKRRNFLRILAGLMLLVAVTSVALWLRSRATTDTQLASSAPAGPTTTIPDRTIDYSLTVQKFHNGKPEDRPFQGTGREIFGNGWKFSVNASSPQAGYLYFVNEGPTADGKITYNLLYPTPQSKGGSARLEAGETLKTGLYRLDENQGTEKFWIVWSSKAVPELEDAKGAVNAKDRGTVVNPESEAKIRAFLDRYLNSKPQVETDAEAKVNHVRVSGDVLVSLLRLEHH